MQINVVGVRFRHGLSTYSFSPNGLQLNKGDQVIVETEKGNDLVRVVEEEKVIDPSVLEEPLKNVIRMASQQEIEEADKMIKRLHRICQKSEKWQKRAV